MRSFPSPFSLSYSSLSFSTFLFQLRVGRTLPRLAVLRGCGVCEAKRRLMYTIAALLPARIVSPANAQQVIGSALCCLSVKPVGNFATSMRAPAHSPPARFLSSTDSSSYSLLSPPLSLTIPVSFCSHCSSLLPFVFSLCCRPAMQGHFPPPIFFFRCMSSTLSTPFRFYHYIPTLQFPISGTASPLDYSRSRTVVSI